MGDRRRSRALLVATIAAALLAGGAAGRLTAPSHDGDLTVRRIQPTAQARAVVDGVRVGYSRTRAGAVAAMAAYGQALADPRVQLDEHRRREVTAAVGTERYAQALERADGVFAARRRGPVGEALRSRAGAVFLGLPISFRIVAYDGSRAVIRSWGVAVVASDTGLQPRAAWGTTTTAAVWRHGDWKVDAVRSAPGPSPATAGTPSPASEFIAALRGMSALRHVP